jgi:hypothetical protein
VAVVEVTDEVETIEVVTIEVETIEVETIEVETIEVETITALHGKKGRRKSIQTRVKLKTLLQLKLQ